MVYKVSPVGNMILSVMHGIDSKILSDNKRLESLLLYSLKKDNFNIKGITSHEFEPYGYSIVVLLGESHASIHTNPEYGSLVFCIYSCRGHLDGRKTYEFLREKLNPSYIDFKEMPVIVKRQEKKPQNYDR
jgi:S-adenosylmethionine decarboxylase